MAAVTETEGTFVVQGATLYTKTWTPQGQPIRAKLVFVHGFSDHLGRYYSFFPTLASRGILVFGFDQRGWGRSVRRPSDRGLTGPTARVTADIAAFTEDRLSAEPADVPLFVMGHSMGGAEVLTLASDPDYGALVGRVRGWLLESPFLDFDPSEAPSWLKVFLGRVAGRLLPRRQLFNPLPPEYFSRDGGVVEDVRADELCHDTGTLEGLAGLLDRSERLRTGKAKLLAATGGEGGVRSMILIHGTADRAVSYPAARKWWESHAAGLLEDGELRTFDGAYHQLHADLCRDEFYGVVGDWILARAGPGNAAGVAGAAATVAKL